MPTDHFDLGRRNPDFARKERTQLGICFAALRRCAETHLQGTVRQLARDFGFRTLRDHFDAERRRRPLADSLLEELMHGLPRGPAALWPALWTPAPLGCDPLALPRFGRLARRASRKKRSGLREEPGPGIQ